MRRRGGGDEEDLALLHLSLIENVLHGFDINRHAIHLAASMLTLSAPKIDYNKMSLYNMQHGVNSKREVRAGSLDILIDDANYLPGLAPDTSQQRAGASGYVEEKPKLEGLCDLVIMNPPFTRNDIRNRSLPKSDRKKVQQHEKDIARKTPDRAHREAIAQSTIFSFFTPIADRLLSRTGTVAIVQPFTACTAPAAKGHRNLLTDLDRFHVEMVITSHDNRRLSFSENTRIYESLVIARRPTVETRDKPVAFVSLAKNPATAGNAHFLAEAVRQALDGNQKSLANYGTIAWRERDQLCNRVWNAACFYDQSLADAYDLLLENQTLTSFYEVAAVKPAGQGVRDVFDKAKKRQNPDIRALWNHKTDRQTSMRTSCDSFLVAKKGKHKQAERLWQKRGNLLVANRMRLNLSQTPAVFSDEAILGSAFVPVSPSGKNRKQLCKAWCVWLNSTFGVLCFLNLRQKDLTYPSFSLDSLRSLPVPHPDHCDMAALAHAFDQYADKCLKPLPEIHIDSVRHALDDAVISAIPDLPDNLHEIRRKIAREPTVNNKKEQFDLE